MKEGVFTIASTVFLQSEVRLFHLARGDKKRGNAVEDKKERAHDCRGG